MFDDYWINYGKIETLKNSSPKKITSFAEYLKYRGLPLELDNAKVLRRSST